MSDEQFKNFIDHKDVILSIADTDEYEDCEVIPTPKMSPKTPHLTKKQASQSSSQGKLLLVALLENYCMLYDQSKEQNQKLFLILCQHLCRMGMIDSTDFLEEFSTVRSSYKRAFKELVVLAMETAKDDIPFITDIDHSSYMVRTVSNTSRGDLGRVSSRMHKTPLPKNEPRDFTDLIENTHPRFQEEFEILELLGRGAFGKVLKTRNLLDSCHYAIKIIKTPSGDEHLIKTLREVKLMADITHINIVRYYSSWLEYMGQLEFKGDEDSSSYFESDSESEFESESEDLDVGKIQSNASSLVLSNNSPSLRSKDLVLFIQMELCDSTLHLWLETLNEFHTDGYRRIEQKILHCFSDLLHGVDFIHKRGYIHRDLKPKNIYWKPEVQNGSHINLGDRNGSWKLGDFGLATFTESHSEQNINQQHTEPQQHSLGIGTFTYASPEQLDNDCDHTYSEKTDIYSLGIILFELLVPMHTAMERADILSKLRHGNLPDEFLTSRPQEAALILWMMSPLPQNRPTVSDIFDLDWFDNSEGVRDQDKDTIKGLKKKVDDLSLELEVVKMENLALKNRLQEKEVESCSSLEQIQVDNEELEKLRAEVAALRGRSGSLDAVYIKPKKNKKKKSK
jgi:translation initiation factor 2-alpha kinase 1